MVQTPERASRLSHLVRHPRNDRLPTLYPDFCVAYERPEWGIFAPPPRGQPPAAERRYRPFERHGGTAVFGPWEPFATTRADARRQSALGAHPLAEYTPPPIMKLPGTASSVSPVRPIA